MAHTTIPVKEETKERLVDLGRGKETWDELRNRLADEVEGT
jgi:hypothetical protein